MNYDKYIKKPVKDKNRSPDEEETVGRILSDYARRKTSAKDENEASNTEEKPDDSSIIKATPISNVHIKIVFSNKAVEQNKEQIINLFLLNGLTDIDCQDRFLFVAGIPGENMFGEGVKAVNELYGNNELMKYVLRVSIEFHYRSPDIAKEWAEEMRETGMVCGDWFYI